MEKQRKQNVSDAEDEIMYESKMKSEATDHLFRAILSQKTEEECYRFFDDLCTFGEILAMTQRYQVAEELYNGKTFSAISEKIGVSSTTITRVNRCLNYGADGYRTVLDRKHGKSAGGREGEGSPANE